MADINVLMLGGRRAGKTSVLSAMNKCCAEKLAGIDELSVRCIAGGISLNMKQTEMEHYFSRQYMRRMTFTPDLNPSNVKDDYTYEVLVNNREAGYTLNFTDIPGEWFKDEEGVSKMQALVDESQVIIISIDTPHMIEQYDEAIKCGKYHKEFNRVNEITRFFKTTFQNSKQERMVIFVPLKCEKYYYRNRMREVNAAVKSGYRELMEFLTGDVKDLCTVAIMPILTIGGAEFFKFDENGYAGIYSYVENEGLREYKPKFCEQPLFLTLYYLIRMSERNKEKQWKISRWFKETFQNAAKLKDLEACKSSIEKLVKRDEELGFEIVQNPLDV